MSRDIRWWGSQLDDLRKDYLNPRLKMKEIAAKYGTSMGQIARLAKKHRWQGRRVRNQPVMELRLKKLVAKTEKLKARMKLMQLDIINAERQIFAIRNFRAAVQQRSGAPDHDAC